MVERPVDTPSQTAAYQQGGYHFRSEAESDAERRGRRTPRRFAVPATGLIDPFAQALQVIGFGRWHGSATLLG